MENCVESYVPNLNISFSVLQKQLSAFIQAERTRLRTCVLDGEGGFSTCSWHTEIWDAAIRKVYQVASYQIQSEYAQQLEWISKLQAEDGMAVEKPVVSTEDSWVPDIALYAVGSYGRRELCYYSDVDVVYTSTVDLEEVYDERTLELIRWFYDFFDSLHTVIPGFEFSFIYRPIGEMSKWNYQDITALIDMRFIVGDTALLPCFKKAVQEEKCDVGLVLDLLKSKEATFKESEETIYLNQPDVKIGRGGLRTIQYAFWMYGLSEFRSISELYGRLGDEDLTAALDYVLQVRNLLHVLANASHDVLSYHPEAGDQLQSQIAEALGYPMVAADGEPSEAGRYEFMEAYYTQAKYLHLKAELLIRRLLANGIPFSDVLGVRRDLLYCIDNNFGEFDVDELFELFSYFQQYDFEIDASLASFIFAYASAFDLKSFQGRMAELMNLPGDVEKSLTRLHRLGILARLGEGGKRFEKAMMTRSERSLDPYTVGKHTLVAIGYLDEIRQTEPSSPFGVARMGSVLSSSPASELEELNGAFRSLSDASLLYMALFLHDIDKPDSRHPETGAEKARRISPAFGFTAQQTEEICFLIREHLTMIVLARYHQWDERMISAFCDKVNSLERLTALYLLTYCDSKANGPHNFSNLVKHNLKRLYEVIRSRFVGQDESQWGVYSPPEEFQAFLQQMPVSYRIGVTHAEIAMHIRMVTQAENNIGTSDAQSASAAIIQFTDKPGFTELHLCSASRLGKLHTVSGLFFANNIDVRDAQVYTKRDTNVEIEIYRLVHQPPHQREPMPLDEELKRSLDFDIRGLMAQETTLDEIFEKHYVSTSGSWHFDDVRVESTRNYTEIVVRGEEKVGFLYYFSGILAKLGLNVEMCKCSALDGQAVDRFYVKPVPDTQSVREKILAALDAEGT